MPLIMNFILLGAGSFCIPITILEPFGMQLSYLKSLMLLSLCFQRFVDVGPEQHSIKDDFVLQPTLIMNYEVFYPGFGGTGTIPIALCEL